MTTGWTALGQKRFSSDEISEEERATEHVVLRRALMYLPVNDMRKVQKAATLDVDCVCLDLEDAVALSQKDAARTALVKVLEEVDFGDKDVAVRINPPQTEFALDDLEAIFKTSKVQPKTLVVPKVDTTEDMDWLFDKVYEIGSKDLEFKDNIDVLTQVESPQGLLNLKDICKMDLTSIRESLSLRMAGLIFGSDDYCAAVGATRTAAGNELLYARQAVVTHAKAFGFEAIDLVNINFNDYDELREEAEAGARMGFTGKQIIHPNQIATVQDAFSPSQERIDYAIDLEAAFLEHQAAGKGAFTFRDQMIDMPTMLQCRNVLSLARRIGRAPPVSPTEDASNTPPTEEKPID